MRLQNAARNLLRLHSKNVLDRLITTSAPADDTLLGPQSRLEAFNTMSIAQVATNLGEAGCSQADRLRRYLLRLCDGMGLNTTPCCP